MLFLAPPTAERLRAFGAYRGIGIAGVARSRDPDWMDRNLPPVFTLLRSLGTPVVHYKVCSTFDSAPHIGSIGRAIDIAAGLFDGWIPMVVGDPGIFHLPTSLALREAPSSISVRREVLST